MDGIFDSEELLEMAGLMRNEWIDEEPDISDSMRIDMRDLAKELTLNAALEDPKLNITKLTESVARIFGAQTSVVGYNVGKPTGGMAFMDANGDLVEKDRYDVSIERFPVIPDDKEIPWLLSIMKKELVGKKFYHQGTLKTVVEAQPMQSIEPITPGQIPRYESEFAYEHDEVPYQQIAIISPGHPRNQFRKGQRVWELSFDGLSMLESETKGVYLFTPYNSLKEAKDMFGKYTPVEGKATEIPRL
jgi:hypothetical protein